MNNRKIVFAVLAVAVMLVSFQCKTKGDNPMSVEENKALVSRFTEEVYGKGNIALIDKFLSPDYVFPAPPPGVTPDQEGIKQFVSMHHTAFPDFRLMVKDIIAEGDKVVNRWTWSGTHKGEFMGIPPTGKYVTLTGISIHRIEDGKIAEQWHEVDMMGLMQQFGVVPSPGKGGE